MLTVALLFSANYILAKFGMREFAPLSFAWLRIAAGAGIMAIVVRDAPPLSRDDSRRVFSYAILGVVINAALFLLGLSMTSVQVAAVLITAIPVFTLALAILLGNEPASATRIGGIALAAAGALLVGLLESFSSFWASAFKEVIVFTLIIPVLLWRSLTTHHHEEDE